MSALTGYRISSQQAAAWQQKSRELHSNTASWLTIEIAQTVSAFVINERLQHLVRREEILRTRLDALPGMALPIQIIDDSVDIQLQIENWKNLPAEKNEIALQSIQQQLINTGLPLQVWLIEKNNNNVLLLKADSGYLDFYSLQLIAEELMGERVVADNLQYVDYAEWKHNLREEDPANPGIQFWNQVSNEENNVALPGLGKTSIEWNQSIRLASSIITLDKTLNVNVAADKLGVSLEEFLFAAWSILLARLQGQSQVKLAWFDDSRGEGLEDGLGLYEQALPVQVDVDLALTLDLQINALLKHARLAKGWRDFYDSTKTCNVYFAFQRPAISSINTLCVRTGYSLGLDCLHSGEGELQFRLVYDENCYSNTAISCLAEQWRLLLAGLTLSKAIGAISLQGNYQAALTAAQPADSTIEPLSIVALIARQCQQNPESPALADHQQRLSYRELEVRSNQLAHYLVHSGVQAGEVVGIVLERGANAIVAILATMKAGATYLPLDPAYPAERLAYMLDDSQAKVVITTGTHASLAPEQLARILLDQQAQQIAAQPEDFQCALAMETPAYLIYTSGSTGKPKAVEINHGNLSHSTQVRIAFYREPVKAYLLLSSFAFDSSVAGIFWTLATGGLLVLPQSGDELDLKVLNSLIKQHGVSHGLSLPSLYETLLDFSERDSLGSLNTWIVAGEACSQQVLAKHHAKVPNARLVNEYGPTEATVWATAAVLNSESGQAGEITIGRPIPTMQLLVVNEAGVLAGIGEPGEIYLGGPSLAKGYRNKPEQTELAFVNRPDLVNDSSARLYRTGDLARYREDGRLDFLGRRDHQIKIRGYRVELTEIERVLQSHSEVRDAVVIAQAQSESHRLVAYVTDRHGYVPESQALANYLDDRLPPYMVPAFFIHLKSLPRTPNGKIDLKALPAPESRHTASEYVAPRSDMEARLAAICAEVLQREKVSVMDDFFAIGGDSILSLQIVARANQVGIQITAKQVFECGTLSRLAEVATLITSTQNPESVAAEKEPVAAFALAGLDAEALDDLLAELDEAD